MKISIRFFNNREVRAIWDEENSKWYFHVIDIVSILNEQELKKLGWNVIVIWECEIASAINSLISRIKTVGIKK